MKLLLLTLPLAIAGCSANTPSETNSVDINAAAVRAQDSVNAYGANAPVEISEPDAVRESAKSNDAANDGLANTAEPAPLDPPAPGTPGGLPDDRTPVSEAAFTPDSAQGAANVVQTYYALIGEKKYAQAFALREPGTGNAKSFAAGFAAYSEYHANIGAPGAIDAGAGQRYVTVPLQALCPARARRGPGLSDRHGHAPPCRRHRWRHVGAAQLADSRHCAEARADAASRHGAPRGGRSGRPHRIGQHREIVRIDRGSHRVGLVRRGGRTCCDGCGRLCGRAETDGVDRGPQDPACPEQRRPAVEEDFAEPHRAAVRGPG